MYKIPFFSLFLVLRILTSAQNQNSIWYFGNNAGIDFNSNSPVSSSGSPISTLEGAATMCNSEGNLLFYSDGITVWNRNHVPMMNGMGLMGGWSSAQSVMIVEMPEHDSIYYIFTTDEQENNFANGFRYSIVNMCGDGGLGAVTTKNTLLFAPNAEKIAGTYHANGTDIWIVGQPLFTDTFYTYRLTSSGLLPPIKNAIGNVQTVSLEAGGELEFSHDGSKMATAIGHTEMVQIFDFDNSTGILSNTITLPKPPLITLMRMSYGLEFSPNNQFLYCSYGADYGNLDTTINTRIYQYDVTASNVLGSRTLIGTSSSNMIGQLQLGNDGKIYLGRRMPGDYLGVINTPNSSGFPGANYVDNGFYLGGGESYYGLQNIVFKPTICTIDTTICDQDSILFAGNHHDTTGVYYNIRCGRCDSLRLNLTVLPSAQTQYYDTICVGDSLSIRGQWYKPVQDTTIVYVFNPQVSCGSETYNITTYPSYELDFYYTICDNDSILIEGQWHDEIDTLDFSFLSSNGCDSTRRYFLDVNTSYQMVYFDTICDNDSILLEGQWYDDSDTLFFSYFTQSGCDSTIIHHLYQRLNSSFHQVNYDTICGDDSLFINGQWFDQDTSLFYRYTNANGCDSALTYHLAVMPAYAQVFYDTICNLDSVRIQGQWFNQDTTLVFHFSTYAGCDSILTYHLTAIIPANSDFTVSGRCLNASTIFTNLTSQSPGFSFPINYLWNFTSSDSSNSVSPSFTFPQPQSYDVTLTADNGCLDSILKQVIIHSPPHADFDTDTLSDCAPLELGFTNTSLGAKEYEWSFCESDFSNQTNLTHTFGSVGCCQVQLIANSDEGCSDTALSIVCVENCLALYVPNSFTPNDDSFNNEFIPSIEGFIEGSYELYIYNRWGEEIFASNSNEIGWNGMHLDVSVQEDIYIWLIKYKEYGTGGLQISRQYTGHVSLIR